MELCIEPVLDYIGFVERSGISAALFGILTVMDSEVRFSLCLPVVVLAVSAGRMLV